MITNKPYAGACERNSEPILQVLRQRLPDSGELLEIGSGTGQHAVMFAQAFPSIHWQTSDMAARHAGMRLWIDEAQLPNLARPLQLDVSEVGDWPVRKYDAIFTANTLHIMPLESVVALFGRVVHAMKPTARFFTYGPFMYDGRHTSDSNREFDQTIRNDDEGRGIRDVAWLRELGEQGGLMLAEDIDMPNNNRMLVWQGVAR